MSDSKISALTSATTPLAGTEVLPIVQSSTTKKVSVENLTAGRDVSASAIGLNATPTSRLTIGNGGFAVAASGTTGLYTHATLGLTFLTDGLYVATRVTGTSVLELLSSTGDLKLSTGNLIQGTAAKGVNFTANTGAAGMTSQLLNWYEEGTFTPTFVPSGTGFTSITYDAATGAQYIRVGRIVHVQIWLQTTATTIGSASGVLRVGGLPFTSAASTGSTSNGFGALSVSYAVGFPGATPQNAMPRANSTQIDLYYQTSVTTGPASQVTAAQMGTGAVALVLAGTYICA